MLKKKTLLIFGGKGFVGENMALRAARAGWAAIIADSSPAVADDLRANISDAAAVDALIERSMPGAVVNVAAIADIDRVEREKDLAYQVNVAGARNIAESCARRGIRTVFFSSDAVFDGFQGGYRENDSPNPLNYYGQTKLEAEQEVLRACPTAAVIRISLVLGFPVTSGNSFFASLESKLRAGQPVPCPTYEVRTPIDVGTLSECVLELCQIDFFGLLHLGATDSIDRYTLSRRLAQRLGYNPDLIIAQETPDQKPGRAPRHRLGVINVEKAQQILITKLLSTEEGFERAFRERP